MDELGTSPEHSDEPNMRYCSFLYAPNNALDAEAISFSICWPTKDIKKVIKTK